MKSDDYRELKVIYGLARKFYDDLGAMKLSSGKHLSGLFIYQFREAMQMSLAELECHLVSIGEASGKEEVNDGLTERDS